ncbi:hypothetical protein KM176_03725 [Pseudooceanicola sp. CBS1P-1]|uniref:AraC family transcriptional regulator n=1 Tax=Pseudooceanicola albus TaxID=2692189 RepID=A0A6L7G566_9RHOB|nr:MULTISPECIES: hypothetical protein [Pseudooceanicola]MBT9382962.1 hypothetical protein [Pseudooceanicola endophyticus]MXN19151.1 hypothetical protein [Pseudooceanicola albus]
MTPRQDMRAGIGPAFGLNAAPSLSVRPTGQARLCASLIETAAPGPLGQEVHLAARDAYFLMLYLAPTRHADIRPDGSRGPERLFPRRSACLVDLREGAAICLRQPLRGIAILCPKVLLAGVAELSDTGGALLRCLRGRIDPVLAALAQALLPGFGPCRPGETALRPIAFALCAHLVHSYGRPPPGVVRPFPGSGGGPRQ